jgi:glutamate-ammonia-ligase adenylyltransferase
MIDAVGPLRPCGPVIDAGAAERAHERLSDAATEGGWSDALQAAWPALAPVFSASPYLFGLARRWPRMLQDVLAQGADARLADVLARTDALTPRPARRWRRWPMGAGQADLRRR